MKVTKDFAIKLAVSTDAYLLTLQFCAIKCSLSRRLWVPNQSDSADFWARKQQRLRILWGVAGKVRGRLRYNPDGQKQL